MSTRCTVDHGEKHHLYADLFEPGLIYLELEGVDFSAAPGAVLVAIPAELWEKIRAHGIGEFSCFWDTDDEATPDE